MKIITKWLTDIFLNVFAKAGIEERIEKKIEELRYDYLPHGACWLCSMPVSRKGGYEMWLGKMFCSRQCTAKYAQLIQSPDEAYQSFKSPDGSQEPIQVFNPVE